MNKHLYLFLAVAINLSASIFADNQDIRQTCKYCENRTYIELIYEAVGKTNLNQQDRNFFLGFVEKYASDPVPDSLDSQDHHRYVRLSDEVARIKLNCEMSEEAKNEKYSARYLIDFELGNAISFVRHHSYQSQREGDPIS